MALNKAPYNSRGDMIAYVVERRRYESEEDYAKRCQLQWRDNTPFHATMTLQEKLGAHSSARFIWKDSEGHIFEMFPTEMHGLLLRGSVIESKAIGMWQICRRGKYYGLKFVE